MKTEGELFKEKGRIRERKGRKSKLNKGAIQVEERERSKELIGGREEALERCRIF